MPSPYDAVPKDYLRPVVAAVQAINDKVALEFDYDGFTRIVEVHAVGMSTDARPVMRAYQVAGDSLRGFVPGWRLFAFDKLENVRMTTLPSTAPREGYKMGDKGMLGIIKEIEL